jgi:hypothetical protein
VRHLVGLTGGDQLEVRSSEENSIDACNGIFLAKGGSCSYDHESIDHIEVPLRYKHIVKRWVPKDIPEINIDFCVNERIYQIAPSSLHGLGIFSMDGIKVCYNGLTELME